MTTTLARSPDLGSLATRVEDVLINGDLAKLSADERISYYNRVCESLGLNPLTQPFSYLVLSGKTVLYAKRDATEQLRKIHGVSITGLEKQFHEGLYIVTATASDAKGRTDASTGAIAITGLKGEALANALMKGETKAKRRVTLSICGLGLLDETEVDSIPEVTAARTVVAHIDAPAMPEGYDDWVLDLETAAEAGLDVLKEAWSTSSRELRSYHQAVAREAWETLKAKAATVTV